MTLDQAYEKINGMTWTLDGVNGKLFVEKVNGMTEVIHTASPAGRRSKKYRDERTKLGDDYTTTLGPDEMEKVFAYLEKVSSLFPKEFVSREAEAKRKTIFHGNDHLFGD